MVPLLAIVMPAKAPLEKFNIPQEFHILPSGTLGSVHLSDKMTDPKHAFCQPIHLFCQAYCYFFRCQRQIDSIDYEACFDYSFVRFEGKHQP
jgi:hypothetical protein